MIWSQSFPCAVATNRLQQSRHRLPWSLSAQVVVAGLLVGASPANAADSTPTAAAAPAIHLARSALLSVDATQADDSLQLQIRRVSDQSLVNSDDVAVEVDGRNEAVTRVGDSYQLPLSELRGEGAKEVAITVKHDGIREILSGKLTLPEEASAGSLLRDHKQIMWWILNIVIVLIAAMAISRRKA
jgi:hypothetical protein